MTRVKKKKKNGYREGVLEHELEALEAGPLRCLRRPAALHHLVCAPFLTINVQQLFIAEFSVGGLRMVAGGVGDVAARAAVVGAPVAGALFFTGSRS